MHLKGTLRAPVLHALFVRCKKNEMIGGKGDLKNHIFVNIDVTDCQKILLLLDPTESLDCRDKI